MRLKRATIDTLEADPSQFSQICDRIGGRDPYYATQTEGGATIKALPTPVAAVQEMGLSFGALREYIRRHPNQGLQEAYDNAIEDRGHTLAEQALQIADATPPEQAEVAKSRLRTDIRKWLARSYAPGTFANTEGTAQASVTVVFSQEDMRG